MERGKFGISPRVIAVIAFLFVILRQPQALLLVVGFALLAEKSEWLNKQVIQALFLNITYYIVVFIADFIFGGLGRSFSSVNLYETGSVMLKFNSFIGGICLIALVVFSVMAIVKVFKGQDAGVPYFSKVVNKGGNMSQPVVQPMAQPMVQSESDKSVCSTCSAPLDEGALFCVECGTKLE